MRINHTIASILLLGYFARSIVVVRRATNSRAMGIIVTMAVVVFSDIPKSSNVYLLECVRKEALENNWHYIVLLFCLYS